jgi:uncharacterized coiled-coil protein SlyX
MKNIFTLIFLLVSFITIAQKEIQIDTNFICLPNYIGKQILNDLNELDRLKSIEIKTTKEISELEKKIIFQEKSISKLEETNSHSLRIIGLTEEKVNLLDEENKKLMIDIGKIKTKNTIEKNSFFLTFKINKIFMNYSIKNLLKIMIRLTNSND